MNYSPQAAELLDEGAIQFDLYKCADWPDMVAAAQKQLPAYVHFPLMAGRRNIEKVGWGNITHFLETTDTPYVNTHLAPRASDFPDMPLDTTLPARRRELVDAMERDIQRLVERFGRSRVILENANWDPSYEIPRPVLEADVISQIVADTGCGFLLDLAHAQMSAAYLKIEVRQYISTLPVHALRELHITGVEYDVTQGRLVDHYPMTEADWELSAWALERIHSGVWARPAIVALEYGGIGPGFVWRSKREVIEVEVPRLQALVLGESGV